MNESNKILDIFNLTEEEFKEYVSGLTPETVISENAFTGAMAVSAPFLQQQRLELLKIRAKELGITKGSFEKLKASFLRGLKQYQRKEWEGEKNRAHLFSGEPLWYSEGKILETVFCEELREEYGELYCINGQFYSTGGLILEGELLKEVQDRLSPYLSTRLAAKAGDLLRALKNFCYLPQPAPETDKIHVKNGYIKLDGSFHPHIEFCMNRLQVDYDPKAKPPRAWLEYLDGLLEPEDIKTLQEYMGYCLLPVTKAEKMLFLIGNGGEGKSVLGAVMSCIFDSSCVFGSLHDLETNRFALADLEARLLFIDDDLSVNACPESKTLKSLVTAKAPLRLERKGQQSYNAMMYCRLMAFGNVPFTTLYDHSDGAFRRRIILTTKPKPPERRDNRELSRELIEEKNGIFHWMLQGLWRLIGREWEFTVSRRSMENLEETRRENFNLIEFMEDETALRLGNFENRVTSRNLYFAYEQWCRINEKAPLKSRTVISYLSKNADQYHIRYSTHINDREDGEARGFEGVKILNTHLIYVPKI